MSRFLLVDDEPAVRAAMRRVLQAREVRSASDLGGEAMVRDLDEQRAALQTLAEAVRQLVRRNGEDF